MESLSQFYAVYGSLINFIGINAILALSLYVTLSAGQLSLGNAAFAGIGAYASGILTIASICLTLSRLPQEPACPQ